ncbi:MAG: hypothetical protein HPY71_09570 [Firmicutes bacterium]|nr:hypothetical protein [Bacillota bacterium]
MVKVCYICDCCGDLIAEFDADEVNPGIAGGGGGAGDLTQEGCEDIIDLKHRQGRVFISSLCDDCFASINLDADSGAGFIGEPRLH